MQYPQVNDCACAHGGAYAITSHGEFKHFSREVCAAQPDLGLLRPLRWSHVPITFDVGDHPDRVAGVGTLPLVVSPIIKNIQVTKMLVEGGAGLNILSAKLMDKLQIIEDQLAPSMSFLGVNLGATKPWGKIELPVTFGTKDNYHTENIIFDVADIALPYNGIIRRPALAKFMMVTHHAYNMLKFPSPWRTLTVKTDIRDAVFCNEQLCRLAATAFPTSASDSDQHSTPIPGSLGKRLRPCSEHGSGDY